jgi:hypothetical protein
VKDHVDVFHGSSEAISIPNIADQKPDVFQAAKFVPKVKLLVLVPGVNPDDLGIQGQHGVDKLIANGPGAPGHENVSPLDLFSVLLKN